MLNYAATMRCLSCSSEIADASRFCSSCGAVVEIGVTPTLVEDFAPSPPPLRKSGSSPSSRSASSSSIDNARFVPGTVLAERYRIVALAGRGGMGEVYRAEDLKLSQTVALKFLPAILAQDGAALARFHREVRIARQVSHANVCRVFDIGEAEGVLFLSMEYVDGEDLTSLLRRIGRLPQDKALEIARQLCAGLAAAHEHGVIHRDLKPANVMLDARGKVRITDFGLAAVAEELRGQEVHAGTPAYMAPEQLAGKEVTVRSDIYSLGLVLYEIFTGKRAFEAPTIAELRHLQEHSNPTSPSSLVKEMDPLVERVILRCLEKDPAKRPAAALQVAAALPGGDPLAAALAAGETPSPEMVAAAGETEGLRPAVAWALLAAVAVGVIASVLLSAQSKLYRRVPLEKPPEVLAERARDIVQSIGYPEQPVDTAMGFTEGVEFLRYIDEHDKSKTRWDHLETSAFTFWYRSSPRPLVHRFFFSPAPIGSVWIDDPPFDVSGMALVQLTPRGHLTQLLVVPPQVEGTVSNAGAVDWAPLFAAAGFDPKQWSPAQPAWTPPVYSDSRVAWTGSIAERPNVPMRIEAAAYRGKPVYFELIGPWTRPERMQPYKPTRGEQVGAGIGIVLIFTLLVGSVILARRNFRQGRGDRQGAARVALFAFACLAVSWLLGAHHVASIDELALFVMFLAASTFISSFAGILYIAVEPYVRRRWPATLVSWSRVLAGNLRDPVVGRDVLLGCVLAGIQIVVVRAGWYVSNWLGSVPPQPYLGPTVEFLGLRGILPSMTSLFPFAIVISLGQLLILFLLRVFLRREWTAAIAFVVLFTVFGTIGLPVASGWPLLVQQLVISSLTVFLMLRFGVLPIVAGAVFSSILGNLPLTTQISAWYAGISLAGLLVAAAMAFYAFYISLGGRPMLGSSAFEE